MINFDFFDLKAWISSRYDHEIWDGRFIKLRKTEKF